MIVSAPGKLVLLGEYAVLEEGRAIVAAVDRRARGERAAEGPASDVVQAVLQMARERGLAAYDGAVRIDTSPFSSGRRKLGIGSSAAAAAVTAGLVAGRLGDDVERLAIDAHRAAAGGVGSGIDVVASMRGGVLVAARQPAPVVPLPALPAGLHLVTAFTGESASTPALVRACQANPRWPMHAARLTSIADAGIEAWTAGDAAGLVDAFERFGRALTHMGHDAGAPIVTDTIARIMHEARHLGGAAKPSGAGGGDVVVALCPDPGLGARLAAIPGVEVLDLSIDPRGAQLEAS